MRLSLCETFPSIPSLATICRRELFAEVMGVA